MEGFFSLKLIGWAASALSMLSFMPQAYSTFKGGNTDGLSLPSFALMFASVVCWFTYGVVIGDFPLIMTNVVMMTTSGIIFFILLRKRLPVIISRMKNRKIALDIAMSNTEKLPGVTNFSRKSRFIRPRRRRNRSPKP